MADGNEPIDPNESPAENGKQWHIETPEDYEVFGAWLKEKGEQFEQGLDASGREALEILFCSPYEKEMTDRGSFLATLVQYFRNSEKAKPGSCKI